MHITAAGYLCMAIPLFLIWLAVFLLYDRMNYATFGRLLQERKAVNA